MKKAFEGFISRLNNTYERISELDSNFPNWKVKNENKIRKQQNTQDL